MHCFKPSVLCAVVAAVYALPSVAYEEPFRVIEGGAWDLSAGPVEYHLEPSGSEDVDDRDLQALRDAFRAWTCVIGTSLRFKEGTPGTKVSADSDNFNTLFWDETNEFGLGPSTLGVTIGDATPNQARRNADIIFNGFDSEWSVDGGAVDVGSIAIHEIGHFLGLDHPCGRTPNGQETDCNGGEQSVMTPAWDGGIARVPFPDDEKGVVALYPADDPNGRCTGPFLKGEQCSCDGECVDGLVCIAGVDGVSVCANECDADHGDACGSGFACVLGAPQGNEAAPGGCVKAQSGAFPPGSICQSRGNCDKDDCDLVPAVGRSVCRTNCEDDSVCGAAGACVDGACLIKTASTACPSKDAPPGCQCQSSARAPVETLALLGVLSAYAFMRLRRRREHI